MTSKNLAIKEDVYDKLLEAKKGDESFSDVIQRLLEGKSELMSYAGIFSQDEEFDQVTRDIEEARKKTVLRT
ncbi:MAG: antitoxin VapB family protein [Nitrososphaerota archaeon]|nr:antitoxin VapB family protein [Nitrososphaerota archaeon]